MVMNIQNTARLVSNIAKRLIPTTSQVHNTGLQSIQQKHFSNEAVNKEQPSYDLGLTDSCIEHLKKFSADGEFLRVSVEGGGCSGFSYKFELDNEKENDDLTFTRGGVEIVTDGESIELIKGSKIDYETELIKSAFRVIDNPQSSTSCSCGVSFSIEL